MTNESTLKKTIREESEKVSRMLVSSDFTDEQKHVFAKWLQSLQRIDDVCKNRNRY